MIDDYEAKYHEVMQLLRRTKMEHGACKPRTRRACTHCNALEELDKLLAEYKGPRIVAMARQHIESKECWCNPALDYVDPESGNEVWVHHRAS